MLEAVLPFALGALVGFLLAAGGVIFHEKLPSLLSGLMIALGGLLVVGCVVLTLFTAFFSG